MNSNSPNKTRRLVFLLSGGIDALIGSFFLLAGFGLLPVDLVQFGFPNWLILLLGAFFFILGIGVVTYNLSRLEE